jgi:hypothetical protein
VAGPVIDSHATATPRFFVDTPLFSRGVGPLQVRDSDHGGLLAQDERVLRASGIAALAGGRSFVIALPVGDTCATRLYLIRLDSRGRPGRLTRLRVPELHGELFDLAASADGRLIGYAVSGCQKFEPGFVGIANVGTGRVRQWGDVNPGGESQGNISLNGSMSLSANGSLLAFTGADTTRDGTFTEQVLRVMRTDARPGTVGQRSRIVRHGPVLGPQLAAASLSPSGAAIYTETVTERRTAYTVQLAAYRTATGRLRKDIASFTVTGRDNAPGGLPALDASGRFLLVPYEMSLPRSPTGQEALRIARIDIATGARGILIVRLPAGSPGSLRIAW